MRARSIRPPRRWPARLRTPTQVPGPRRASPRCSARRPHPRRRGGTPRWDAPSRAHRRWPPTMWRCRSATRRGLLGVSRQRAHQLRQEGRLQPTGGVTRASVLQRLGAQAHGAAAVASTQAAAARQDGASSSTAPLTAPSTARGPAPSPPAPLPPRAPRSDDPPPILDVRVKEQGTARRRRRSDDVARQLRLPTEAAALGRECPACVAPAGRMCRDVHSRAKRKPPARQVHLARYWLDRRCPACKAPPRPAVQNAQRPSRAQDPRRPTNDQPRRARRSPPTRHRRTQERGACVASCFSPEPGPYGSSAREVRRVPHRPPSGVRLGRLRQQLAAQGRQVTLLLLGEVGRRPAGSLRRSGGASQGCPSRRCQRRWRGGWASRNADSRS